MRCRDQISCVALALSTRNPLGLPVLDIEFTGKFSHRRMGAVDATDTGDVRIAGRLTAGVKTFRIDHPLDPGNKYLSHSSVESQDMMNIYNGNITTNTQGNATVVLPDYFEALNGDFRYQLTVIGRRAQAIVTSEIKNNRFSINTDHPDVKVSWQVTGIRQDASAKAFPSSVEEEKPEAERGLFLHPEHFGYPRERGIAFTRHPDDMHDRRAERPRLVPYHRAASME
jgi:hypothetical protein